MKILIFDNYDEISTYVGGEIINKIKLKKDSVLGFATGSSPLGVYRKLIYDHKEHHTSYKGVKTFNLDEYHGLNKESSHSYYHFMFENLFKHIDILEENINIPDGVCEDIQKECMDYNEKLRNNTIDIQLLGVGRNGHIGFNEPGTPFNSVTHCIKLAEKTRIDNARFFDSLKMVPTHAITMGIKNILDSKRIILIATGVAKSEAIKRLVNGPVNIDCPVTSLITHNDVTIVLDREASEKL